MNQDILTYNKLPEVKKDNIYKNQFYHNHTTGS